MVFLALLLEVTAERGKLARVHIAAAEHESPAEGEQPSARTPPPRHSRRAGEALQRTL